MNGWRLIHLGACPGNIALGIEKCNTFVFKRMKVHNHVMTNNFMVLSRKWEKKKTICLNDNHEQLSHMMPLPPSTSKIRPGLSALA